MTPGSGSIGGLPFGWGAIFGLLNLILGGGVAGAWIKLRPKMREVKLTAEEKLRDDLITRVQKLEADKGAQDARLEAERARHDAQMAIMRHRVNNSEACLDALLMLLKTSPDKVSEAVVHIEQMRARQQQEVAIERGAQIGAAIASTSQAMPTTPATPVE